MLWPVTHFGAKPKMIIKGGMIAWAVMGDPNASIPTCEPQLYRPMFGAYPAVIARTCVTFVSQAAHERGVGARPRPAPLVEPVRGCRTIGKRQMVRNDRTPRIDVDPETYEVRVDGETRDRAPGRTSAAGATLLPDVRVAIASDGLRILRVRSRMRQRAAHDLRLVSS